MLIKVNELWKYAGAEVLIKDDLATPYIPKGYYKYIDKDSDGTYMMLNQRNNLCYLDTYDSDSIIQVTENEPMNRVRNCIEGYTVEMMGLIQDGWTCDSGNNLDLTPYKQKLNEYINLENMIRGKDEILDDN